MVQEFSAGSYAPKDKNWRVFPLTIFFLFVLGTHFVLLSHVLIFTAF